MAHLIHALLLAVLAVLGGANAFRLLPTLRNWEEQGHSVSFTGRRLKEETTQVVSTRALLTAGGYGGYGDMEDGSRRRALLTDGGYGGYGDMESRRRSLLSYGYGDM
jgi:hypothetical protein